MRRLVGDIDPRLAAVAIALLTAACGPPRASDSARNVRWTAACPRDAARDASGRCACTGGAFPLLGACVPAAVGDSFCGPAARVGPDGCVFRPCSGDQVLDVASGACLARASLAREGAPGCAAGSAPLVESGRIECVAPDATCPRGTQRDGASCSRGPRCPPGTLRHGDACQPVVTAAPGVMRVDLGAWAALTVGIDGGPAGPGLCLPLDQRPAAFGLERGDRMTLNIRMALIVPDQDVSRVHATVAVDAAGRPVPLQGEALVAGAVDTLVEVLRSLGGVSSVQALEVEVRCGLALP